MFYHHARDCRKRRKCNCAAGDGSLLLLLLLMLIEGVGPDYDPRKRAAELRAEAA